MAQTTNGLSFKDCDVHLSVPLSTTLDGAFASSSVPADGADFDVASTAGFPSTCTIWLLVGTEILECTVKDANTFTLAATNGRGADGSTPAAHLTGATISLVYADISGFANEITVSGGDRATAEAFTFDGDTPILTSGKRAALDVTVKVVYTEGDTEPAALIRAAYEAKSLVNVRWMPRGNTATYYRYTTTGGVVTSQAYPSGSASSADAVPLMFTLKVESITKSAVPTP